MRFATIENRSQIGVGPNQYVDLETASRGKLPSSPMASLQNWAEVIAWSKTSAWTPADIITAPPEQLGPPVPQPRQIFAVGLNYARHAAETDLVGENRHPLTFTKFASSVTGPHSNLELPTDTVDWEVELVVVIGTECQRLAPEQAWAHIAGLTLGQDLSERTSQMAGDPPQFSLGKSYPGFAPLGPHLVTPDEINDLDDISLECRLNDDVVQSDSTRHLIHSIPHLVAHYSSVCTLYPGDLIFTGTPEGVGMGRKPPTYLQPGDVLTSSSPQIGQLVQHCTTSDISREA